MRSAIKRIWAVAARPQIIVCLVFALMVGLSSWYIDNFFRQHLNQNAQAVLDSLETNIKVDLLEPRTALGNISQTIRIMILEGGSAAVVHRYLREMTDYIQSDEERQLSGFSGIYGYFGVLGGEFIDSLDRIPPETYVPEERPWYREAVAAGGSIVFIPPYADIATTSIVITHARALFNDEGRLLGAVALDLRLDRISEYTASAHLGTIGNGVMLSEQMEILSHPDPDLIGKKFDDLSGGYPALVHKLRQEHVITEYRMKKYDGVDSIYFIRQLENGWYIGVVTPENIYYQELGRIRVVLIFLGTTLVFVLTVILLEIVAAKNNADERMRVLFNAMPLGASYIDSNFNFLDCNQGMLNLFGLSKKQEYFDRFYDLSPEYQPDGRLSRETADELIRKTYADGYCHFEWLHRNLNGELIPCEMVLVRVRHNDEFVIAAYTRDLRELKQMMKEIQQRENLMNTVNSVANILLSVNDEGSFETSLLKSFGLVGNCLDVDRVQIWRNEELDGELHFVHRYEWLSEYGRSIVQVPIGLHFPYSLKPDWKSLFSRGEYINAPLSGLPEDDRAFLEPYGMKSIVMIPMFLEGNFWGVFRIVDCRRERTFTDEEIHILTSVGLMMGGAVNHNLQTVKILEANERARNMFDATPMGTNLLDRNYNNIDCNQEAMRLFGVSNKQEYLDRFYELSPEYQPDGKPSKEKAIEVIKKAYDEGYCRCEWMHQKLNGEMIPCQITLVRIAYKNDFIVAGNIYDLRDLKSAMAQINESEQSLSILANILNGLDAMIYVTVPDTGEILFVNDQMKKHFNMQDDGIGQMCYEVFQNGKTERCDFCPCHKLAKEPDSIIVWEEHNNKTNRKYRNTDRYIEWQDGQIAHIQHSVDVTELIAAKEQAEQSSRFKSQFLSRMSHEIRTPMNAILGITEIQLQSETLQQVTREALDRIYNSGYMLLGIINDILDLSKIEAGKLELTPIRYDVPSLINDTVNLNAMLYDSKPVEFRLQVDKNIPSTLFGDELRIKQILNNLLSNAFKYTDTGEVSMSVRRSALRDSAQMVTLEFRVADTGQGMTAEQLEKLFDDYSRFNMEANRTTEGTGLGMNITRHLVHMMNGEISVESEPGKGSVFTVRLPQGLTGSAVIGREVAENLGQFHIGSPSQTKKATQIIREYMPYGRVLIVDDVETNLYVARGLITPYGLSIQTASSGFEAVEKIKDGETFDIVFMDHYMPKMDGMETVKIIRGLGYTRPIICLTANALAGQAEMFMENGFDGFISKPIDIRQLNAALNKMIRDKYPPETVEAARRLAAKVNMAKPVETQPSSDPKLAAMFVLDAEKALATLKAILANGSRRNDDIRQYIVSVHSMKSALANIGETGLSDIASKLEQAGRAEDTAAMTAETPAFLETLREVIEKNKPREDDSVIEQEESDETRAYLNEKLLSIQTGCENYDIATVNRGLAELGQKKWPRSVQKLLDTISEFLLNSDFEEAAKLVKDYCTKPV